MYLISSAGPDITDGNAGAGVVLTDHIHRVLSPRFPRATSGLSSPRARRQHTTCIRRAHSVKGESRTGHERPVVAAGDEHTAARRSPVVAGASTYIYRPLSRLQIYGAFGASASLPLVCPGTRRPLAPCSTEAGRPDLAHSLQSILYLPALPGPRSLPARGCSQRPPSVPSSRAVSRRFTRPSLALFEVVSRSS
jgi:hypothetical protein